MQWLMQAGLSRRGDDEGSGLELGASSRVQTIRLSRNLPDPRQRQGGTHERSDHICRFHKVDWRVMAYAACTHIPTASLAEGVALAAAIDRLAEASMQRPDVTSGRTGSRSASE
jgi:hypothetical protein